MAAAGGVGTAVMQQQCTAMLMELSSEQTHCMIGRIGTAALAHVPTTSLTCLSTTTAGALAVMAAIAASIAALTALTAAHDSCSAADKCSSNIIAGVVVLAAIIALVEAEAASWCNTSRFQRAVLVFMYDTW
jgi:hypothetical protein